MPEKIKIKIRALQTLSIGDGRIVHAGDEAEIERTQASIDLAVSQGLYEVVDGNTPEVPTNG